MDVAQVERWVPGVRVARTYRRAWLRPDLTSGLVLAAILAPWIAPFDPDAQRVCRRLVAPNWANWFGCDAFGRDMLGVLRRYHHWLRANRDPDADAFHA